MATIPVRAQSVRGALSRYPRAARVHRIGFSTAMVRASEHKSTTTGVARALADASGTAAEPTLFKTDFSLGDRVALVTGANSGLGLESALALIEGGARAVYCLDLADAPSSRLAKVQEYVSRFQGEHAGRRLEYIPGDVRDQERMWKVGEMIGDREGRMDVCLAAAGIVLPPEDCLRVPASRLQKVLDVNLSGALYTAQAAGQQMNRFGGGGSIMLIASIAGHVTVPVKTISYDVTKSGVLQMARTMACELAPKGIRVNSISPGFFDTPIAIPFVEADPESMDAIVNRSPMKRHAEPHEFRGVVAWLASDASSFCTGTDIRVDGGYLAW
ncbi:NAD-P-binding protein [Trametes cingulata]|nr:NAD-P-binding protein [Trametes cingulata]